MAADAQNNDWPLPKFYFSVKFESLNSPIPFQEVSGLDTESDRIEFRHGENPAFSTVKMPGISKFSTITLNKGIFQKDNGFWNWYNTINLNTTKRETVRIQLLDETGNSSMNWTLTNAFPTKITGTDINSAGEEIAVELIELAYEGLSISTQ